MASRKVVCRLCNHEEIIEASAEAWALYDSGAVAIQRCFPDLAPAIREMLAGPQFCGTCFDKICK